MHCTSLNVFSTFRSSPETVSKWCLLMPPSFFSSPLPCPQNVFLWGRLWVVGVAPAFVTINDLRKKVRVDFQVFFQFTVRIHSGLLLMSCEHVRHEFCCNSFHLQFLAQNPLAGTPGHTRQINKIVNCSVTVFQEQFTNYRNVFICSGGRGSPWARLVCKWQFTIPEAGKPLVDLCFPQCSFLVSCFKHYNCFPCHFP